jgi:putative ABC transport system permease protein
MTTRLVGLAWHYLWARPLVAGLNLCLMTLGIGSMCFVLLVARQLDSSLQRDLAGIDLVVGAKGSPLQLILAGVFHLDVPTGNIPATTADSLRRHPLVAGVVPLALGDSMQGHRIVGTDTGYLALYGAKLAQGRIWSRPLEAVLGDQAARSSALELGAAFVGTHGLGATGQAHGNAPYTVVGRLAACGCVLDRLVLTGVESVWALHDKGESPDGDDQHSDDHHEITLLLARYRSPLAAAVLPRWVNAQPGLQSAVPALESARLLRMVGAGTDVLRGFAVMLMLVAALSVFVALYHAVREREPDLAMMRLLGAPPRRVAWLVTLEAMILALMGLLVGLLLGHALAQALGWMLARERSLPITGASIAPGEYALVVGTFAIALLAAGLPAWRAQRLDVTRLLQAPQ